MFRESFFEQEKGQELEEQISLLKYVGEKHGITIQERNFCYQYLADRILLLLPEYITVFELSANIFSIRRENIKSNHIDESEVCNLEWVEQYVQNSKANY